MDDYLSKPIDPEALRRAIERWIPRGSGSGPAADSPVARAGSLDAKVMDDVCGLLGAEFPDLIETFVVETPSRLVAFRDAADRRDANALYREVHALKGASRNLGAVALAGLCQDLEEVGRSGTTVGADAMIARIEDEFARVRVTLERECRLGVVGETGIPPAAA